MLSLFLKGFIIGFSIAAPVGPIGVLCIHRSLHQGFRSGLATGCGAALADGTYGMIAGFGLTFIASFLINHIHWIKLFGGLFLLYLGFKILISRPAKQPSLSTSSKSLIRNFMTTFFLTLTNPMTIFSFIAVFASFGLGSIHTSYYAAGILILGIILGSLCWWLLLSGSVAILFRNKINQSQLYGINFLSGIVITIFGVTALLSLQ